MYKKIKAKIKKNEPLMFNVIGFWYSQIKNVS